MHRRLSYAPHGNCLDRVRSWLDLPLDVGRQAGLSVPVVGGVATATTTTTTWTTSKLKKDEHCDRTVVSIVILIAVAPVLLLLDRLTSAQYTRFLVIMSVLPSYEGLSLSRTAAVSVRFWFHRSVLTASASRPTVEAKKLETE